MTMQDINTTLNERGERYGKFSGQAALSQALKRVMHAAPNWDRLSDAQKEGLEMVQHKIATMLNGDPTYLDNIVDIIGYSTLIQEVMENDSGLQT